MKRAAFFNLLVIGLALGFGGAGCKKPRIGVTPLPPAKVTEVPAHSPPGAMIEPMGLDTAGTAGGEDPTGTDLASENLPGGGDQPSLEEIEGMLGDPEYFKEQTVYFDFDSAAVKRSEHANVNFVGDALKDRSDVKLMIDGHCDERGTEEYNRSLGERRALSLREYLVMYGIDPSRIRTRSWGEDHPADPGQDEVAYAKNRRGEFILLLPQNE